MTLQASSQAQLRQFIEQIERSMVPTATAFLRELVDANVWAVVRDWPGYEVSARGNVKGPRFMLVPVDAGSGYLVVSLGRGGTFSNVRVNRLVAQTFLGDPPFEGALVAHNDGNKANNVVTNLRWASALENQADRVRHGTHLCGSAMKHAKLKECDIPTIRMRAKSGENYAEIAADFGVSVSTISLIRRGTIWRHVE